MAKRLITEKQEQALRLCHQDFNGLSLKEAAKRMGISPSAVSRLLTKVKKVLPNYFPLLTKLEAQCYHFYTISGWRIDTIAEYINSTPDSIYKALKRARDKGACFAEPKGRILSYDPNMDAHIIHKF